MERYFLNETEVPAPKGIDGITRHKTRSRRYFSVLYKNVGYANGVGNVTFTDALSRSSLLDAYRRQGVAASTRFRMETDGATQFDAYVDYATSARDKDGFTCAFRDNQQITTLESQSATGYAVEATDRLRLTPKPITGPSTHTVPAASATVRMAVRTPASIDHALPLVRPEKAETSLPGELLTVAAPAQMPPIYRNTTPDAQSLRLSGTVTATVSASASLTARLLVRVFSASGQVTDIPQGELSVTTSPVSRSLLVEASLSVPAGGWVVVGFRSDTLVTAYTFAYDTTSRLTLESSNQTPASYANGLTAYHLLSALVSRSSGGTLSLVSDYLTSGQADLFITNGANLRGLNKPIVASLQDVFDGLTALYPLALWIEGDTVRIEPLTIYLTRHAKRSYFEQEPILVKYRPYTDYLPSEVLTGFETWQGSSGLAGDEFNGSRRYLSQLTTLRTTLDLRAKTMIGSGTLIEEQRAKQFASQTASTTSADSLDDKLFVLATATDRNGERIPETRQPVPFLDGVIDRTTPYNVRLSPRRSLGRWAEILPLGRLHLESATGSTTMQSRMSSEPTPVSEADPLTATASLLTGERASVTMAMTQQQFNALGDWITLNDNGEWITGLLMEASWQITLDEGGICQMELFL